MEGPKADEFRSDLRREEETEELEVEEKMLRFSLEVDMSPSEGQLRLR